MKKHLVSSIKFLVFLVLGGLLVWLAVKDITAEDQKQIERSVREANYFWVILSVITGILAHLSRAIRWKMLLAPLNLHPKLSNTFYAVMIGYLGNLAFPRLGEVLRCGILKRYEKIPITQSFGTVIAERIIDLILMLALFVWSAWIEFERLQSYMNQYILNPLMQKVSGIADNKLKLALWLGLSALILLVLFFYRKAIVKNKFTRKIGEFLISFLDGMKSVSKVKSPALFIFHSLFIWAMYFLSVYVCIFAFDETKTLSLSNCLVLMCFGGLGVIATPGGIGAYHWIVLQIMLLWGYTTAIGVAFGWVAWLSQTVAIIVFGLLSFALLALGNKEKEFED